MSICDKVTERGCSADKKHLKEVNWNLHWGGFYRNLLKKVDSKMVAGNNRGKALWTAWISLILGESSDGIFPSGKINRFGAKLTEKWLACLRYECSSISSSDIGNKEDHHKPVLLDHWAFMKFIWSNKGDWYLKEHTIHWCVILDCGESMNMDQVLSTIF